MNTKDADANSIIRMMVGADHEAPARVQGTPKHPILKLTNVSTQSAKGGQGLMGVNLTVHAGEIVGIAGVSGNGQSAFAGLISGLVQPTNGEVFVNDHRVQKLTPKAMLNAGIGRIPEDRHHDGIVSAMSVAENLVIERLDTPEVQQNGFLRKASIAENAHNLTQNYDVRGPGINARSALLSGGNIQKLILARVLETNPDLILANQPTRGLDFKAASDVSLRLFDARDRGAGVILISEDLDEVLSLADRILVMHDGQLIETDSRDRTVIGLAMAGGEQH